MGGGKSAFARVEVEIDSDDTSSKTNLVEETKAPMKWLLAARHGAANALVAISPSKETSLLRVVSVEGTYADTNENIVWCAAGMAAFDALALAGVASPRYDSNSSEWVLDLEDGRTLRFVRS